MDDPAAMGEASTYLLDVMASRRRPSKDYLFSSDQALYRSPPAGYSGQGNEIYVPERVPVLFRGRYINDVPGAAHGPGRSLRSENSLRNVRSRSGRITVTKTFAVP